MKVQKYHAGILIIYNEFSKYQCTKHTNLLLTSGL